MKKFGLGAAALLITVLSAMPAWAWSEKNCRQACRDTAVDVQACYAKIPCSKYRGYPDSGKAAVNNFARSWNARYGTPAERRAARAAWQAD